MILVAGSANLDFVVRAAHIPAPGETVLGHGFRTHPGGKGANQAVACARAGGAATRMLLALGSDHPAEVLAASLRDAGVSMQVVRCADEPTGTAFICVSDDAENAITVAPGANLRLGPEHLPALQGCSHLLMQLETPLPTVLAYARAARAAGVHVVLNAAPAQRLSAELLAELDTLIVNEGELAQMAGAQGSVAEQIARLQVPTVVVTLGGRGACARAPQGVCAQPAFPVRPVDTTGAGDTFCGALVAALARGDALPVALREAAAAAALACTLPGAQSAIPDRAAVRALLERVQPDAGGGAATLLQSCGF